MIVQQQSMDAARESRRHRHDLVLVSGIGEIEVTRQMNYDRRIRPGPEFHEMLQFLRCRSMHFRAEAGLMASDASQFKQRIIAFNSLFEQSEDKRSHPLS